MSSLVIQAQYENLDQIAKRFVQEAELIEQMQQQVHRAVDALQNSGWMGQGATAFSAEMESNVFPGVYRLNQALQEGSRTTHEIIAIIANAEKEAAGLFGRDSHGGGVNGSSSGATIGSSSEINDTDSGDSPSFLSRLGSLGGKAASVYKGIKTLRDFAKNWDKFDGLADFLKQRNSIVSAVKDKFRTKAGQAGLILGAVGAGLEALADINAGQSITEVAVSEGVEFALETGIRIAAYSNPVSAGLLTVWDGAVLVGDLVGVKVPSLGDVTDAAGNMVYDVGKAISKFGGGLIDGASKAIERLKFW